MKIHVQDEDRYRDIYDCVSDLKLLDDAVIALDEMDSMDIYDVADRLRSKRDGIALAMARMVVKHAHFTDIARVIDGEGEGT